MADVLVLCTGNSCRSQMAQTFLQAFLPEGNKVYSAGVNPKPVHPMTVQVMREEGFDVSANQSNHVDELSSINFAWILTVSETAQEKGPIWVKFGNVIHKQFFDPSKAVGTEDERLAVFRNVRDEIKAFCKDFVKNPSAEADDSQVPEHKRSSRKPRLRKMINYYVGQLSGRSLSNQGKFA